MYHDPVDWESIARHISTVTNKPISVSRCQALADRSLIKISDALQQDARMKALHRELYTSYPQAFKGS
jgi:hypothetical protein